MNERVILSSLANDECPFLVNLRSSFQDRENCYLLIDYLPAGDLRHYINRKFAFNEQQIRKGCPIQGSWCAASSRGSTTSTVAASSTETSSRKTSSSIRTGMRESPTWASPSIGSRKIQMKRVAHRAIWRQRSCSGRTTPFQQTCLQWESLPMNCLWGAGPTLEGIGSRSGRKCWRKRPS
jgi:hypothetical protein